MLGTTYQLNDRILIPDHFRFKFKEPDIKPHAVTKELIKNPKGMIIGYNPIQILINRDYGGFTVMDDGFYIKPEIDLYELFISTVQRLPFSSERVEFVIPRDVAIIASSTATPAISVGNGWGSDTELFLTNRGIISGRGGNAGISSLQIERWGVYTKDDTYYINQNYAFTSFGTGGEDGGTALQEGSTNLKITNYGLIAGGGGGGSGCDYRYFKEYAQAASRYNEHSGTLSNSGGAPYGKPYDGSYTWQRDLMDKSGGSLLNAWNTFKGDNNIGSARLQYSKSTGVYQFILSNGVTSTISLADIPTESHFLHLCDTTKSTGSDNPSYVFWNSSRRVISDTGVLTEVLNSNGEIAKLATMSGLTKASEAGGDIGEIMMSGLTGAAFSPFNVLQRSYNASGWRNGIKPNRADMELLFTYNQGSKGGNIGENGGYQAIRNSQRMEYYQYGSNNVTNNVWAGFGNTAPPGEEKIIAISGSFGKAGYIKTSDTITIENVLPGTTKGR